MKIYRLILSVIVLFFISNINVYANDSVSPEVLTSGLDSVNQTYYAIWSIPKDTNKCIVYKKDIVGNILNELELKTFNNKVAYYDEPINNSVFNSLQLLVYHDNTLLGSSKDIEFNNTEIYNVQCNGSTLGFNQAIITWSFKDKILNSDNYKYNIYRNKKLYKRGVESNLFIDTDLNCNSSYNYCIEPYFIIGDIEIYADKSKTVTINTNKNKVAVKSIKLVNDKRQVKISIEENDNANIYRILRSDFDSSKKKFGDYKEIIKTTKISFIDAPKIGRYKYKVQCGFKSENNRIKWGKSSKSYSIKIKSTIPLPKKYDNPDNLTPIIGDNDITIDQMKTYFNKFNGHYPEIYAEKGAETFEDFCEILNDVCEEYHIRNSVVFAQVMCETATLAFGGDVSAEQCNFSGFGATGGVSGNTFKNVREGLTAQVQHLRLYADPDFTRGDKDPRWNARYAGKCPYLEWLSIPNNPNGVGWAMSDSYYQTLKGIMDKVMSY